MRRLLLFALVVVLTGVVVASAAALDVSGGVMQVFRIGVEVEVPVNPESATDATVSPAVSVTTSTSLPSEEPSTTFELEIP